MPRKGGFREIKWSMQPSMHDSVTTLLRPHDLTFDFYHIDEELTWIQRKDTNIMGKFIYTNRKCPIGA
ncbi:hypothetical protein LTR95_018442 [Oleoguttula sp. CCFEE 5521]